MEFMIAIFLLLNAHRGETVDEQAAYRTAYVQRGVLPTVPKVPAWEQKAVQRRSLVD